MKTTMTDPAKKYAGKVDPKHALAMSSIGLMQQILKPHREQFERLINAEKSAHSHMHILDPTLYRDMLNSRSFAQQIRLVTAALKFINEVDAVARELEKPLNLSEGS